MAGALVQDHGIKTYALLDSGAAPYVISFKLAKHLRLNCEIIEIFLTVADGSKAATVGKIMNVPVFYRENESQIRLCCTDKCSV